MIVEKKIKNGVTFHIILKFITQHIYTKKLNTYVIYDFFSFFTEIINLTAVLQHYEVTV